MLGHPHSSFRRAPGRFSAGVLLLALLATGFAAVAGESKRECVSSKLTNQLLDCAHCQNVKKLLGHAAIGSVSMEVHELEHGAIVQIETASPAAVKLVHEIVEELWNAASHCDTQLSSACQERFHALSEVFVDRALTSHGAIVVLRSEDPAHVAWLRQDAHTTRSIVLSAATR